MGDQITSSSGKPVVITSIKGDASEQDVYNLTVNGDHSYAVGELGVWSHNVNGNSFSSTKLNFLYQLYDGAGRFLRWGVTNNPKRRLVEHRRVHGKGCDLQIVEEGSRVAMIQLERWLEMFRAGPKNFVRWANRGRGAN